MDISAWITYLKEHRHKEAEQLWRGFSDKFNLSLSSSWFDAIAKCFNAMEEDPEHTNWAGEMKAMLRSERCDKWRAQYLLPKRSRLHGIILRATAQESSGAIVNAQNMIQQARHVLTNNVQGELAGLLMSAAPLNTQTTVTQVRQTANEKVAQDVVNEASKDSQEYENTQDDLNLDMPLSKKMRICPLPSPFRASPVSDEALDNALHEDKAEHIARLNTSQRNASIITTDAFTHRSFEDPVEKDDATFDEDRDFGSAAVSNDGEADRNQEAEESDDDNDDELAEIILPHDFHALFEALYRAANNQALQLPKMPKMESTLKMTLFQHVKDHLIAYRDLCKVKQKDLFVAASSVVYLHCADSETIFKLHDMPNLLEKTKEPDIAVPSNTLLQLLKRLKDQAQDDQGIFDVGQLADLIDIEKGSLVTKRSQGQKIDATMKLALDILQIVVPLCAVDPIHRPVDTEQKSQAVWERVFNTLFAKTVVTAVIGETGLKGSSKARSQNEAEYAVERPKGKKASPRKVDCKFVVSVEHMKKWEFVTISNSEMKPLRSTAVEVEMMVRKNIRLNHFIINQTGTPKMYFLNMQAYSASLMSLREHDGAHVCGKVLNHDLLIPTNHLELECFMDGRTLAALFSLRSYFLQVGRKLALQRLNSGSRDITLISAFSNVRTFFTPQMYKSMPPITKRPPPPPKKRPFSSSS